MSQQITLKQYVNSPAAMARIQEVLKERAPQFASSLVQVAGSGLLSKCEPGSVLAAGMTAALLDLPIDRNLGFAHLVPYSGVAQFQMGYKGFIQLALRTGQYARRNAKALNEGVVTGLDEVGEPIIDWSQLDETQDAVGYFFGFKLVGGFTKTIYWTKEKVTAHAKRFSQAFRAGKKDSPWFTNFDAMALKTVVKDGISHWGIMSVELREALLHDQGVQMDIDATVVYPDNQNGEAGAAQKQASAPDFSSAGEKANPPKFVGDTPQDKLAIALADMDVRQEWFIESVRKESPEMVAKDAVTVHDLGDVAATAFLDHLDDMIARLEKASGK